MSWTLPYNNPMAIIQSPPDNWKGLKGSDKGKLIFTSMPYGVRAGVINLNNGYFKKGINTLISIFTKYAPTGHGANNPKVYAEWIAKKIGVTPTTKLDFSKHGKALCKAIIQYETGSHSKLPISEQDFESGWKMATGGATTPTPPTKKEPEKEKKNWGKIALYGAGGLILLYGLYKVTRK